MNESVICPNCGVRCMQEGKEFVAAKPLTSLPQAIALLHSYRAGNGLWTELIEWR